MDSGDWKRRAAWLNAVAQRVSAPNVAGLLLGYAEEMLQKADEVDDKDMKRVPTSPAH